MDPRACDTRLVAGAVRRLDRFNRRHPWSHNDHFHGWILRNLPARRTAALDIGCGRGALLDALAGQFARVHGIDPDAGMRAAAGARVAGRPNASVDERRLDALRGPYDLVTMVAVLHHLDVDDALPQVERLLAPGGRLLVVGLNRPESLADHAWDLLCAAMNPLIGLAKHPRRAGPSAAGPGFPVADPQQTYAALRRDFARHLPGTRLRRRLGFRYTAAWTKPA